MTFKQRLAEIADDVETRLETALADLQAQHTPTRLLAAIRHGLLGGGKRFRPFLVVESAALFDIPLEKAIDAAAAVECLHSYSLIHDDLPQMDNDALRRGQPTTWAEFDDWTAILAGDGLQALAFELMSGALPDDGEGRSKDLIGGLARASGSAGMVGGQALDLGADKLGEPPRPDRTFIENMQALKTGALIEFSAEAGAILAGASQDDRFRLRSYGRNLGLAFQIADDLLDVEGDAETVGKAVAKDDKLGKATLVSLMGLDAARARLFRAERAAIDALEPFGSRAEALRDAAHFVVHRDQ